MSLWKRYVVPRLIDCAMRNEEATARRSVWIPRATGHVVELGIGSGHNLPFYSELVTDVTGIDPSNELLAMARKKLDRLPFPVELVGQSAERLPVESGSVDTVVTTWTLCSIPDTLAALREARRVLRPGGRLLFVEHGRSPDPGVYAWQRRLTPIWKRIGSGCHLDRKIDDLIAQAGFEISELHNTYLKGPRPMTYTYEGWAQPRSDPEAHVV